MTEEWELLDASTDAAMHRPLLWLRPSASDSEWKNFKLEFNVRRQHKIPARKNFWLGYNGTRWSRGTDTAYLAVQHPEVLAWAEERARNLFASP